MRTLLNIIWFLFAGVWLWLGYVFAGLIACIFIVTIPIGVAAFRMAHYVAWPFGRTVIPQASAGTGSLVANVVWFVVAGWWLAIAHVVTAFAQAITIVGIMNAYVSIKMIPVTLFPFGKQIVSKKALISSR